MDNTPSGNSEKRGLDRYISGLGIWAISIGTAIGCGSFVVTGNAYLSSAGPLGSTLGLVIGALVMFIIARNYHYMIETYPDAGGAYTYTKKAFGFDYGFLTAWFLILTYIAVFWANVTSLPIFAGYLIGDFFRFGFHYSVFGYDIYLGEILLSLAAVVITALFCTFTKKLKIVVVVILSIIFAVGISICFVAALLKLKGDFSVMQPVFAPDSSIAYQIAHIAFISPWAFIGFENISHFSEEINFPVKKIFRILCLSVAAVTLLYLFMIFISVSAFPPEYENWFEYIRDLGKVGGLRGLPAFYATFQHIGITGEVILIMVLFSVVITSLICNSVALSRLIYGLSKDQVFSERYSLLNAMKNPPNAFWLIVIASLIIPFIGRTAVGWIVDVTALGASLIYGFVSGAALVHAWKEKRLTEIITGIIGVLVMAAFVIMLLVPNFLSSGSMATESYFLFAIWAIIGMVFFHHILRHDHKNRRFGRTGVVWVVLLMLILMTLLEWVKQLSAIFTQNSMNNIIAHYSRETSAVSRELVMREMQALTRVNNYSTGFTLLLFTFAVWIILSNHSIMVKREAEHEKELEEAKNAAYTDPLTGVKSKTAYAEKEDSIESSMADGEAEDFAVLVCDINGLKQVNDSMGHKAGDLLIKDACRMICEYFKHSPVFRIGGDEFVVILTGRDYDRRQEIMEDLNRRVEYNKRNCQVVIATGISEYDRETDKNYHEVFERADALMYVRKNELKNM
ncbi:MAG: amino acid permease [Lachnospiraceae bacterium]|nr:amino acid permease [Lachnospiraceae bacterium]